jgi:hypothetical protein
LNKDKAPIRNPDVSNLKVKKVKVKNKELAERNIREGKLRLEGENSRRKGLPGSEEESLTEYRCKGCL